MGSSAGTAAPDEIGFEVPHRTSSIAWDSATLLPWAQRVAEGTANTVQVPG
jgi:hypothetical protein